MDYQAVGAPTNYGAPQVFGQQQGQGQQDQMGQQIGGMLQKAKQLLSSGQISADQYNQLATQYMGGNMGQGMPGATGAPMSILPGQGG